MMVKGHNLAFKMLREEETETSVSTHYIATGRLACLKTRDPKKHTLMRYWPG